MKRFIGVIILISLSLFSCKKDKLEGDSSILIGQWAWVRSERLANICNPPTFSETIYPSSISASYTIKLFEKGKIYFFNNGIETGEYKIDLTSFIKNGSCPILYPDEFTILLDGEYGNFFDGCVGDDTLMVIYNFPFPDTDCDNYTNYFVRE